MTRQRGHLDREGFKLIDYTYPGLYDAIVGKLQQQLETYGYINFSRINHPESKHLSRQFGISVERIRMALPYYRRLIMYRMPDLCRTAHAGGREHPQADAWIAEVIEQEAGEAHKQGA